MNALINWCFTSAWAQPYTNPLHKVTILENVFMHWKILESNSFKIISCRLKVILSLSILQNECLFAVKKDPDNISCSRGFCVEMVVEIYICILWFFPHWCLLTLTGVHLNVTFWLMSHLLRLPVLITFCRAYLLVFTRTLIVSCFIKFVILL